MAEPVTPWIVALVMGLFGGGGIWGWLSERAKAKAAVPPGIAQAQASFQLALNAQSNSFTKSVIDDRRHLEGMVRGLSAKVDKLQHDNLKCEGENAQLRQLLESLEANLRSAGIDIPERPKAGSFTVIEDGHTTSYLPTPAPRADQPRPRGAKRSKPK